MTRHKAAASASGGERPERLRNTGLVSRSRMKLWMIRATTMVLLCTCVVQLAALGETWGPRLLKGWPSCFLREPQQVAVALGVQSLGRLPVRIVPPKRVYENNGFLMVSCNGGLNQMRAARVWEGGWRDRILDWGIAKREKAVNICPQVSPSTRQVLPNPFHDPFLDYLQGRVASYL